MRRPSHLEKRAEIVLRRVSSLRRRGNSYGIDHHRGCTWIPTSCARPLCKRFSKLPNWIITNRLCSWGDRLAVGARSRGTCTNRLTISRQEVEERVLVAYATKGREHLSREADGNEPKMYAEERPGRNAERGQRQQQVA
jgi:hypothetical protein